MASDRMVRLLSAWSIESTQTCSQSRSLSSASRVASSKSMKGERASRPVEVRPHVQPRVHTMRRSFTDQCTSGRGNGMRWLAADHSRPLPRAQEPLLDKLRALDYETQFCATCACSPRCMHQPHHPRRHAIPPFSRFHFAFAKPDAALAFSFLSLVCMSAPIHAHAAHPRP